MKDHKHESSELSSKVNILKNPKFLVFLTIIFWSFGLYLTRLISINLPFLNLNIQFFLIFLFFLTYAINLYRRKLIQKLLHVKLAYLLFGLFGYFIYFLGLWESFKFFNSASNTAMLNYTFPLFTIIFRDLIFIAPKPKTFKVTFLEYGGLVLGFLAIVIFATHGTLNLFKITNMAGIVWGLLAGISYGIFSAYSSSISKKETGIFLLVATFESWIMSIFLALPELTLINKLSFSDYFYQFILAIIVNCIGFVTWTRANRLTNILHLPFSSVASLIYILPFLSLSIISYFLKETELFKGYFFFSLVLLILGTFIAQKSESIYDFFK